MTYHLEIFRILKLDIVLCGHRQFRGCSGQAAILQTLIALSINHRAAFCEAALPRHIPLAGGSGNEHLAGGGAGSAAMKSCRKENPITRAVPADAPAAINVRLLIAMAATSRCALNRPANALVGATPADDAGHLLVDLLDRGMRRLRKQRRSSHDLPGLAISALWDLFF